MPNDRNIYGEIDNKTNLRNVYLKIRKDVEHSQSRAALTELYRRAGYLITLSYAPSWEEKFGAEIHEIRSAAEDEFRTTARKVNSRAKVIGTEADYNETWGESKNG